MSLRCVDDFLFLDETVKTETQKDQADGDSESGEDENENEEDKPAHPPRQV